jgi:hypothetical protein
MYLSNWSKQIPNVERVVAHLPIEPHTSFVETFE